MSFTSTNKEDYIVDVPYDRSLEKHNIFNVLKSGVIEKLIKFLMYKNLGCIQN